MERYIDLHTHSTCSDGTFTPEEIIKKAYELGLAAVAITDHDTLSGVKEAIEAGKKYGIEVIAGIEFSVDNDYPMHILGLDFSFPCSSMENTLNALTADRQDRMKKILLKLKDLGISIDESDVMEFAGGKSVGRPHIAQAMVKKGYVSTILEAFQKYLAFGMPAYVKRKKLTAYEIINLIKENGGQSFVAHLHQTGKTTDELYEIIADLKAHGLDGIEGYHTEYTAEMGMDYCKLADDLGLIISGGSDFHGNNKVNVNLGTGRGNMKIPYSVLENIKKHRLY